MSAQENAGVLCTVQVSSWSLLIVTIRDNTPSGHQSQVGCKCHGSLHTASSHCSLLLYPAISGEAPPRCVPSWTRRGVRRHQTWRPTVPPSLSTPMSASTGGRGRGWSTPGLTSDCPLQLDIVQPPHPGVAAAGGGHLQPGPVTAVPLLPKPGTQSAWSTRR